MYRQEPHVQLFIVKPKYVARYINNVLLLANAYSQATN